MSDTIQKLLRRVEGRGSTHWYRNPDGPEAAAEIDRLNKRIEELEQTLQQRNSTILGYEKIIDGHHITTPDQINEAWERRLVEKASDPSGGIYLKAFLLGIVTCPKCGGTNRLIYRGKGIFSETECDCPNNGWVIESEKEEG